VVKGHVERPDLLEKWRAVLPDIKVDDLLRPGSALLPEDVDWLQEHCPHGFWQNMMTKVCEKNYKRVMADTQFGMPFEARENACQDKLVEAAETWMESPAVKERLKQEQSEWYVYLSEFKMMTPKEAYDRAFSSGKLRRD
jgi:hypothetical protein